MLAARLLDAMFRKHAGVEVESLCDRLARSSRVAALKERGSATPELVVVDVELDGTPGVDLIRELRTIAHLAETPIVVLTGCTDARTVRAARAAGADAVYSKQDVSRHISRWTSDVLSMAESRAAA